MPYAVAKPGTISAAMLISNTYLASNPSDSAHFYMKVKRAAGRHGSPDYDLTGDGDEVPQFENNLMLYGGIRLSGWMLSSKALGVANIIDPTKNPITIRLMASSARLIDGTWLLTNFDWSWDRDTPFVAVQITGTLTGTTPSGIES